MDNKQTVHAWFHRNPSSGRSQGGNIFYEHDEIYSYGKHFMMARMFMLPKAVGKFDRIVVITTDSYSITTSAHQGHVRSAIDNDIALCAYVPKAKEINTLEDAFRRAVDTAFDDFNTIFDHASRFSLTPDESVQALRNRVEALVNVGIVCKDRKNTKGARELLKRLDDPELLPKLRGLAEKLRIEREAKAALRRQRIALRYIAPMLQGKRVDTNTALEVLIETHKPSEFVTQEMLDGLDAYADTMMDKATEDVRELLRLVREGTREDFANAANLISMYLPHMRVLAIQHVRTDLAGLIVELFDYCLDAIKNVYTDMTFVDGGPAAEDGKSVVYRNVLNTLYRIPDHAIMNYAWGDVYPDMHSQSLGYYDPTSVNVPNCAVWRAADGRVRTSMGVEIGAREFKRFCRIIRALDAGTMTVADIPEDLRRVQGSYTVHRYENGVVTVGCHRIAMRNLVALADLMCTEA